MKKHVDKLVQADPGKHFLNLSLTLKSWDLKYLKSSASQSRHFV